MNDLSTLLNSRYDEIKELILRLYKDEEGAMGYAPTNPTLKATLFLLYYNLMESIVYSMFEMLFDEVAVNCSEDVYKRQIAFCALSCATRLDSMPPGI